MELNKEEFEKYLKNCGRTLFYVGNPVACPVAKFVKKKYPDAYVAAFYGHVLVRFAENRATATIVPKWANEFMKAFDTQPRITHTVTAPEALKVLYQLDIP